MDTDFLADTIFKRVDQLITERNILRRELAGKSRGNLALEKEFLRAFQNSVIDNAAASEKISRLEHLLMIG